MGKLFFPGNVGNSLHINRIQLFLYYKDEVVTKDVPPLTFRNYYLDDEEFEKAVKITARVEYKDSIPSVKEFTPSKMFWKNGHIKYDQQSWLRKNTNSPFTEDEQGVEKALKILEEKKEQTKLLELEESLGNKNLVYYCIGGKGQYFQFLEWSVDSILKHTKDLNNIDFLFFCPQEWVSNIEKLKKQNNVNFYYEIIPNTEDGVEVAMHRLRIFDFSKIKNYKKILYIDSDILCFKDLNGLFDKEIEHERFYAVKNCGNHKTFKPHFFTHSIIDFNEATANLLQEKNQVPMNTGQFLILNSNKMEKHFQNIRWLHSTWPLKYFFEQCFFNHYFCTSFLSNTQTLEDVVYLQDNREILTKEHTEKYTLIHFVGPPLDGQTKNTYITEQLYALNNK